MSTIASYPAGMLERIPGMGLGEFLAAAATANPATIKRRPLNLIPRAFMAPLSGFRRVA
jgi:hypothetical protein